MTGWVVRGADGQVKRPLRYSELRNEPDVQRNMASLRSIRHDKTPKGRA